MKTKILFLILATLLTYGCNKSVKPYRVFDYEDFGPQAMAWGKIGMQWWQWDNHGDRDPKTKYDIKVVVYADMSLDEIKQIFPINKDRKRDFRYIEYDDSIKYLDRNIRDMEKDREQWSVELKERLLNTKEIILQKIKRKN
jgi:hypothetical protein